MLFLLLILISILSGVFGSFIVWNKITNYFDNFTHSAIFSVIIGNALHLNEFYTLCVFASLFALSLSICIAKKIKLNNNLLIIIGCFFVALSSIFNDYFETHVTHNHEEHESGIMNLFLGNNIDSLQAINLNNYIFLSLILLVVCIIYHKDWLKIILNQQLIPMQSKNYIQYFIFLFAVGLFSIVTVKINGVLLSIGTSILPVFIVKNFANTPNKMILYTIIFNILISLFSFIICSNLNINYNGFVVLTEFAIFILLSFLNVGCEKHC